MSHTAPASTYRDVPANQVERLLRFRATHPRQQVTLSGIDWTYLVGGAGPTTLLIPAGGERLGDVGFPLVEHFEQGYCCVYLAFPPLSAMRALVDGVADVLDHIGVDRVMLMGASFGGDIAQCFVRAYPTRVDKLILMNTGIPDERLGRATRRARPLVSRLPMRLVRTLLNAYLGRALAVPIIERAFWRALLRELIGQLTRADIIASFDDTIDYRLNYHFAPSDLAHWSGNALILQSDNDPATSPAMRQAIRTLYPSAQMHVFHSAGHTPFLSQPDQFYPLVDAFLREP
jgi:pimeloyl-ACP methyl ester carboxylesterase